MASTISVRPDLKPGRGDEHDRDRRAADELEQAGGDPALAQRAEVALEAAVLPDRGEVVDQAEEPEAEHREQHRRARLGEPGLGADAERAEHRAAGVDDEHGEDDEEPARGRRACGRGSSAVRAQATTRISPLTMRRKRTVTSPTSERRRRRSRAAPGRR